MPKGRPRGTSKTDLVDLAAKLPELRQAIRDEIGKDQLKDIAKTLLAQATDADNPRSVAAATALFQYVIGTPTQQIPQKADKSVDITQLVEYLEANLGKQALQTKHVRATEVVAANRAAARQFGIPVRRDADGGAHVLPDRVGVQPVVHEDLGEVPAGGGDVVGGAVVGPASQQEEG